MVDLTKSKNVINFICTTKFNHSKYCNAIYKMHCIQDKKNIGQLFNHICFCKQVLIRIT